MIHVVAGIIYKNNKVFCARRKSGLHLAGFWEFPGGKVELGEEHEPALSRELREELSIEATVGAYIGQSTHDYGGKIVRLHAYLCEADMGAMVLNDHDEICWLAIDELNTLQWAPADVPLLSQLSTYIYYETMATSYTTETINFNMDGKYSPFLNELDETATILDLGCGSARDSLVFKSKNHDIQAIDACPNIAAIASKTLSQNVAVKSCFNMGFDNQFDGVWACASLLHCPKSEFSSALENIILALKPEGCAYISLKKGDGELFDDKGRYFSFYQQAELEGLLGEVKGINKTNIWIEESPLRGANQAWINILIFKDAA